MKMAKFERTDRTEIKEVIRRYLWVAMECSAWPDTKAACLSQIRQALLYGYSQGKLSKKGMLRACEKIDKLIFKKGKNP